MPTNAKKPIAESTIFDLTENEKLIEEVIGFLPEREEYETYADPASKATHMLDYAEHVHDADLVKQIQASFAAVLAGFFNE